MNLTVISQTIGTDALENSIDIFAILEEFKNDLSNNKTLHW